MHSTRCLLLAAFVLLPLAARAQAPDRYFAVEVEEVALANAPALHSGAAAQHDGRWLFVAGRTNGVHPLSPPGPAFPEEHANDALVVYDPAADAVWTAALDALPAATAEPLRATNVQFHQEGEALYVVGGYGYSAAAGGFVTFGTLTAIDVPGTIEAVVNGAPVAPHVRQMTDDRLAVTGGHLVRLGDRYFLVGGHRFDGEYLGAFTQAYTEAVRSFAIDDTGTALAISGYAETTDAALLHRRDGNVGPVVHDGADGWALYGGVFNAFMRPYRTPVYFDDAALEEHPFEAEFGHYTTALLPLYDAARGSMHTVFFGGMGQFYANDGSDPACTTPVCEDPLVPFIKDVAVLSVAADGTTAEALLDPLPDYLGTNGYLLLDPAVPTTDHGVVELDEMGGRTLVGHLVGGIAADAPHPAWYPTTGTSWASDRVFALYVTPLTYPVATEGTSGAAAFSVTLAGPNPFHARTRLGITLDAPGPVRVEVFDAVGRRVARLHDGPLAAGPHVFDVAGEGWPSGVYVARVTGPGGTAAQQLVRLR